MLYLIPLFGDFEMLKSTRAFLLTLLLTVMMAFTPLLHAQEAAGAEDSTMRNLILGAAAVIILIIYLKRRNKRKTGN